MKRKSLKFIACAAVMALTLSVTACGGSGNGASSSTSDAATVEDTADTADVTDDADVADEANVSDDADAADEAAAADDATAGDDENFETLEEAFANPEVKAAMDEQMGSMNMDGMEISYEVTGNDFIVTYKVIDTVIDDPDDFAEQMDPVMDQLKTIFSAVAETFDEAIGKEGATSVVVRYLDADDTLLIERSYKAE